MKRKAERTLMYFFDVLVLSRAGRRSAFRVVETQGDGARCFELHRHAPPPGEPELYLTWLPRTGPRCTCAAGRRGKRCRHVDAVLKLIAEGRL